MFDAANHCAWGCTEFGSGAPVEVSASRDARYLCYAIAKPSRRTLGRHCDSNSDESLKFTRPPAESSYYALRFTEHEIDEVLQTGDNVLIGGFIVLGNDATAVVLRALGPSLPLTGTLADPTLELHDANGRTIVSNDDWRSNQEPEITYNSLQPANDAESAIFAVRAGPYTAIVQGKDGATGVALVEVYRLTTSAMSHKRASGDPRPRDL